MRGNTSVCDAHLSAVPGQIQCSLRQWHFCFCFVLFLLDSPERPVVVVVKAKPDFQQLMQTRASFYLANLKISYPLK